MDHRSPIIMSLRSVPRSSSSSSSSSSRQERPHNTPQNQHLQHNRNKTREAEGRGGDNKRGARLLHYTGRLPGSSKFDCEWIQRYLGRSLHTLDVCRAEDRARTSTQSMVRSREVRSLLAFDYENDVRTVSTVGTSLKLVNTRVHEFVILRIVRLFY